MVGVGQNLNRGGERKTVGVGQNVKRGKGSLPWLKIEGNANILDWSC